MKWNIEELTGYTPKTTFWQDFTIADRFGVKAIKETYNRAFNEWKNNVEYLTELIMVLNWKIYAYYEVNCEIAIVYNELWEKSDEYAMKHLKGKNLNYYLRTTD